MTTIFVSASGTEMGKTFVARVLIRQLKNAGHRVHALKPVVTGFDPADSGRSDSGVLLGALGRTLNEENLMRISPWRFEAALSPDMAAARAETSVAFDELVAYCLRECSREGWESGGSGGEQACREERGADVTLIEGIGGIMVPLNDKHTVLDWIAALRAPVILVVGSYLGTLSHTLTAVGMLQARGQELAGIVVNESLDRPVTVEETASVIARFVYPAPVRVLPHVEDPERAPDLLPLLASHL